MGSNDTQSSAWKHEKADSFFQSHPTIKFVRCQWVDYSGILRARVLSLEYLQSLATSDKPIPSSQISFCCMLNDQMARFPPSAKHLLYPDWDSLRAPWIGPDPPDYATVMCFIFEELPRSGTTETQCPRAALRNVRNRAANEYDLGVMVGFEIEFTVLRTSPETGDLIPFSTHPGLYSVAPFWSPDFHYFEECIANLTRSGVEVREFHSEGWIGQYEVVLAPHSALKAVDELVAACDIIKTTFGRHGLTATMSPKPILEQQANGAHIHLSIDNHFDSSEPAADIETAFLAGILHRLPALCALTLPTPPSYQRRVDGEAGRTVSWASNNKSGPIRKVAPGHWEVRCADATANKYLAVAGLISAGLQGIQDRRPLEWEDMAFETEPAAGEELPSTLQEALDIMERQTGALQGMLNSRAIEHYIALKRQEAEALAGMDEGSLRQRLAKYF